MIDPHFGLWLSKAPIMNETTSAQPTDTDADIYIHNGDRSLGSNSRWIVLSILAMCIVTFCVVITYQYSVMMRQAEIASALNERNYNILTGRSDIINAIANDVREIKANIDEVRKEHDGQTGCVTHQKSEDGR